MLIRALCTLLLALAIGSAHAVRVSETGVGGVLLGAVFWASDDGYQTRIRIVNHSAVDAVKARLSLRSRKNSEACRDFVLYLSPSDVAWLDISTTRRNARGEIVGTAGSGQAALYSTDDSLLSARYTASPFASFASQSGAAYASTTIPGAGGNELPRLSDPDDSCRIGHLEVVGLYAARGTISTTTGNVLIRRGMSKFDLLRIFDTLKAELNNSNNDITNNTNNGNRSVANGEIASETSSAATPYNSYILSNPGSSAPDYSSRVLLSGNIDITNDRTGDQVSLPMLALREGSNPVTRGTITPVVDSPTFDAPAIGEELQLGNGFASLARLSSGDNIGDIEAALAAYSLGGTFVAATNTSTFALVTLPTKYRHRNTTVFPMWTPTQSPPGGSFSFPFQTTGNLRYQIAVFDEQENWLNQPPGCFTSPCATENDLKLPDAVNYLPVPSFGSSSGWFRLQLIRDGLNPFDPPSGKGASLSIPGVPVIGFAHRIRSIGGTAVSTLEGLNRPAILP